jgi:DNA-binding GntR family transcriptional regulator
MWLNEQSYRAIRRDIIRCVLEPGSEVNESGLCAHYGLGKASIRVALSRLSQEGFVRSVPRRGHVIAPITVRDVEQIYAMRLILEPAAARLACGRIDLDALRQVMIDTPDIDASDVIGSNLENNRNFHLAIATATGNGRLIGAVSRMLDDVERVLHLWGGGKSDATAWVFEEESEHRFIFDAFTAGDAAAAEQTVRRHLESAQHAIMDAIVERRSALDLRIERAS